MADKLTQLQDCLDQLATQFYASLRYITTHHPSPASQPAPSSPPPQYNNLNPSAPNADPSNLNASAPTTTQEPPLISPEAFAAATKELARDLITKQLQIETLVKSLPGIESSEKEQMERIQALEGELRELWGKEGGWKGVGEEKEMLLERVEGVIGVLGGGKR